MNPIRESLTSLVENQVALLMALQEKGVLSNGDIEKHLPLARHLVEQEVAKKREDFRKEHPGVIELMELFG